MAKKEKKNLNLVLIIVIVVLAVALLFYILSSGNKYVGKKDELGSFKPIPNLNGYENYESPSNCERGFNKKEIDCEYKIEITAPAFKYEGNCKFNEDNKLYEGKINYCECYFNDEKPTCKSKGYENLIQGEGVGCNRIIKSIYKDKTVTGDTIESCFQEAHNFCEKVCEDNKGEMVEKEKIICCDSS